VSISAMSLICGSERKLPAAKSCKEISRDPLVAVSHDHFGRILIMSKKRTKESDKTIIETMEKGYVARRELSLEIKHAGESLQASCHWAFNLAEGIEGFQDSFLRAVSHLQDLEAAPLTKGFDLESAPKIISVLSKVRRYCRQMADESKPLSVDGIIEDCQELERYATMLEKLTKSKKA
jgi:hypothetical protein